LFLATQDGEGPVLNRNRDGPVAEKKLWRCSTLQVNAAYGQPRRLIPSTRLGGRQTRLLGYHIHLKETRLDHRLQHRQLSEQNSAVHSRANFTENLKKCQKAGVSVFL
jgi:hypothetical protein